MRARKRLSLLVAIMLSLQIILPTWGNVEEVFAASSGPVIVSLSPADDASNVPTSPIFKVTFDENIEIGDRTKNVTIYRASTNTSFLSYEMNNSRISVSNNVLTINASSGNLPLDTDFYILIEAGALKNKSNGALYTGMLNASDWNFRTVAVVDNIRPTVSSVGNGICDASGTCNSTVPINGSLQFVFSKPVYVSSGDITITNMNNSADNRTIPVTSSEVQGSGSNTITITPSTVLTPSTTYNIRFTASNFSDASNNFFVGANYRFITEASPIQLVSKSPISGATNVATNGNLTLTFDQDVQGNSSKYITIRKVNNNEVVFNELAKAPLISISGKTVTINTRNVLAYNTSYYVTMDSGAITKAGDSNAIYSGMPNASDWFFTTSAQVDTTKPTIKTYSPEINSKTVVSNDKLVLTFSKPVFPNNGTIEIYEYNSNALYRSINVTSNRVTGGGTEVITIDPHSNRGSGEAAKTYTLGAKYYVKISSSAFNDAAGNTFDGITNKNYYYQVASNTGTGPLVQNLSPVNGTTTVATNTNTTFKATFDKTVVLDYSNLNIGFIPVSTSGSISEVPGKVEVDPNNSKSILITPSEELKKNTEYYINISDTSIMDSNGNYFVGILNQYQWTFKTLGGDTTPPTITKGEVSGDTIRLVYNKLLIDSYKPSPASFYVTVAGNARNISSISIEGNVVFIKLSSSVSSSQKVIISYTKPATGLIQDLSGNQAKSFANLAISNGFTDDRPALKGSSYSGKVITLNFSTDLNTVSKLAYTQFSVTVNGTGYSINNMTSSGSNVKITLNQSIPSNAKVVVSYSSGLYPLSSTAGSTVNSFTHTVGSITDTSSGSVSGVPKIKYITLTGKTLYLKYNETLRTSSKPGTYQYSVLVNNRLVNVTAVSISGDTVALTLASKPSSTDTITVTYVATSSSILDTDYNAAESFKNMTVGTEDSDDAQAVTVQGAILKGNTLTLNFSGRLNQNSIPDDWNFAVRINSNSRIIKNVNVSGSQVIIILSTAANVGETATVSYFNQSNDLKSAGGIAVSGFTNMSVANQTTLLDALSDDFGSATNGVLIKTSASSKSSDTSPGGRSAYRYTIATDKITTAVNTLASSNMTNANLVFEVPSTENAAIVAYSVLALDAAKKKGNYTLVINYGDLTYSVPLSSLDLSKAASQSGGNAVSNYIKIAFEEGNTSATSSLVTAINRSDATLIEGPFAYEVSVVNGSRAEDAVIIGDLTRTIKTSSTINKGNTSAVFYDPAVSAISYVPTTFSSSNGEMTITLKRSGNGAYGIVRNTKSFSDTASHWANNEISIMARKFIVEGHSSSKFNPSASITRGEFATYIVKGLGISANPNGAKHFTDVNANTMMGGYIGAAVSAGIVAGVSQKSFAPNSYITRQDMAIMMIRAASYAGLSTTMSSSADSVLTGYTDKGQISSYAKTGLAKAVNMGIIGGTTTTQLSPKKNATRAEGTLMIMRLLKKVDALQY